MVEQGGHAGQSPGLPRQKVTQASLLTRITDSC